MSSVYKLMLDHANVGFSIIADQDSADVGFRKISVLLLITISYATCPSHSQLNLKLTQSVLDLFLTNI